jgi:hypothetical protein
VGDLSQEELIAGLRWLPWKAVVKLLKDIVEQHHQPREMPQTVLDWFDFNRKKGGTSREEMEVFRGRLEQFGEVAGSALHENFERAPIGPWWIELRHYLRDGKRWWLLRAFREGAGDVLESSKGDLNRLYKIVDYAGGDSKQLLIDAGDSLLWTWRSDCAT